ncbi:DUF2243 domain-containing protein [Mesorhizobium sp. CO1-1-7]|uniref:DUF2243 domain-containing protein n=1 Tax=unclassified Mesorhizobium TaxID=325217 RepID=UPI001129EB20|nr:MULTISPECIES: DUF2243 domain-containing protein [unclassified Mesorhizobium]MBZ9748176.1 DUF2243 domain-containing protein [Mesorhizobium sp. CO1-1-7]TPL99513.1 DUF2243 domain-containing protein [Mesorhizobium sp. B2-3-10]
MDAITETFDRRIRAGWLLLGFALGGFLDGIVLHQILQWHHLLSGLADPAGSNLRFQIMADGLFHLFMYVLAVAGAVLLVAARAAGARPGTTTEILRVALVGFGVWHIFDAVLFHWLLGLHRIKMNSDMPLAWDMAWLVIFGIVPLLMVVVLPNRGGPARGASAALTSIVLLAGLAAGAGPLFNGAANSVIVFRGGMEPATMMRAIQVADARLKWVDGSGTVWAVDRVSWRGLVILYVRGALVVSTTPIITGCLAWTDPAGASPDFRSLRAIPDSL